MNDFVLGKNLIDIFIRSCKSIKHMQLDDTVNLLKFTFSRWLAPKPWQKMEVESPLCTQPVNRSLTNSQYSLNLFPH